LQNGSIARPEKRGRQERTLVRDLARTTRTPCDILQWSFESHYYRLKGTGYRLHYLDEGHGEVVVMLHGNPTWSFYYRNLVKELKKYYRCIVPDHLGCGLSDKPQEDLYTLDQHIERTIELLESLNIKHYHLVVHDWGGAIGMAIAQRWPARLKSLVILNTAAFHSTAIPFRILLCKTPILGPILVRGFNLFARMATSMAAPRGLTAEEKRGYLFPYDSWRNRVAIWNFIKDIPLTPNHRSYDTITKIEETLWLLQHKSILILWGGLDFCFTKVFLKRWQSFFPNAKTIIYEYAGHYVLDDAVEDTIPEIRRFLMQKSEVTMY